MNWSDRFFHGEADPVSCKVHTQDPDLYDIADLQDISRVLDIFFADLCDMHQTILMHADIDKGAEIHHVSNRSGQFHTDGQILDIFDIATHFGNGNILRGGRVRA